MTATRSVDELRNALAERAASVRVPGGLAVQAMAAAGKVRRRRRVTAVTVLASVVLLSSYAIEGQHREEPEPATPTPSSVVVTGQVTWSATLPGLDLPAGEPLSVPYAAGDSVFVDRPEPVLTGGASGPDAEEQVVQLTNTPMGLLVVSHLDGLPVFNLRLVDGQAVRDIARGVQLSGMVAVGTGADGELRVAFAEDGGVQEGPLLEPRPVTVVDEGRAAVGFVDGDALFGLTDRPGIERLHREPGEAMELLQIDGALSEHSALTRWASVDGETLAIYTDTDSGCTTAYRVPGSGAQVWEACDDLSRATMIVGPRFGAVGATVYDAASGAPVRAVEIPGSEDFEIAPIGWESPTSLVLRVVSYQPYGADGSGEPVTVPPRYVAVRCAVDSGACERLPHPVDVIASEVGGAPSS